MKFLIMILLSTLIMLLLLPSSYSLPQEESDTKLHVFLLGGQSNMVGRGGINETTYVWDRNVPPECSPSPRILRLNENLEWEEAVEPLHRGIENFAPGVGPGMPFANRLLKKDSFLMGDIGLVPVARGQTNITTWQRGGFLYNRLLQRADASVRRGGTITALLWYQGESDASANEAPFYEARLRKFFDDVRSDLRIPSLPIIQVALNPGKPGAGVEIVRKVQLELDMPFVRCVDAKGLALQGDRIYLTTDAQIRLGEMMADAFVGLLSNCSV